MKINDNYINLEQSQAIKMALTDLINQPSDKQSRPCPGCCYTVGDNQSTTTSLHCSSVCPMAARQMSSEPQRYPIEQGIVPLVYAFYTLRLMTPCWSCEGHDDKNGHLCKTPKLWFYSSNDFYAKLVAQYVSTLHGERKIDNPWTVRILPFSQSMFTTTYSLEPLDIIADITNLQSLRNDITIIAENLRHELFKLADQYIIRADKVPIACKPIKA